MEERVGGGERKKITKERLWMESQRPDVPYYS